MDQPRPNSNSTPTTLRAFDEDGKLFPPQQRQIYTPPPHRDGPASMTVESKSNMSGENVDGITTCSSGPMLKSHKRSQKERSPKIAESPESLAEMLRRGIVKHQLGLSVNLVLLVCLSWLLFPSLRQRMEAFLFLSYRLGNGLYGQGPQDLQIVVSFIVVFTAVRAFSLDYVLTPAASLLGIRRQKPKIRFAEQGFLLLYYCFYWTWGVYLLTRDTPASLPGSKMTLESFLISFWTDYPRLYLDASMKLYYLSQLAFWAQQIIVIHLEEKRKDHYQMLTHHFVTVALISTSYGFRQCRVGNAVLVCMDVVDLIFPLAKMLRYIGWQTACDIAFALFVVTWLAARHAAYLTICWSIYAHVNEATMFYGTYSLRHTDPSSSISGVRDSEDGGSDILSNIFQPLINPNAETVSFNARIRWSFLGLLLGLQCITLMWFVMICRVVARVLRGGGADDSRSDDEGDEEDVEHQPGPVQPSAPFKVGEEKKFIEVESTAEELSYDHVRRSTSGSGSKRRSKGISSGLNLGDRKDILNRIGCLSEEQLAREREKREGSGSPRPGSGSHR